MISFVSKAWGGRASDREVVQQSTFLKVLDAGDRITADRGFPIQSKQAKLDLKSQQWQRIIIQKLMIKP